MELVGCHIAADFSNARKSGDAYGGITTLTFQSNGTGATETVMTDESVIFGNTKLAIHFDSDFLTIQQVQVKHGKKTLKVTSIESEGKSSLHWIQLGDCMSTDTYGVIVELVVPFQGKVNSAPEGVYFAGGPNDLTGPMLVTQFEVTHARKAFPCVDIPCVKQKLSWTITLPGLGTKCFANGGLTSTKENTEKSTTTFSFAPTESAIPMYVAAFCGLVNGGQVETSTVVAGTNFPLVSDTLKLSSSTEQLPLSVIVPKGSKFPVAFALKCLEHSLTLLTQFFEQPLPLTKLELIAVPRMTLGGMEHHGVIFINEKVGTGGDRKKVDPKLIESEICRLVVHEVTHHWIGNSVGISFAMKEGVCQILEESIGDVVLGLPMRKRKPAATSGEAAAGASKPQSTSAEEGKELTGHTYQVALAETANSVAIMGWDSFRARMRYLVANFMDLYAGTEFVAGLMDPTVSAPGS